MLLTDLLPEFHEAQKSHTTTKFFQKAYQKFFAVHPEVAPTAAVNPHPENTPEALGHDQAEEAESSKALQKQIIIKQAVSVACTWPQQTGTEHPLSENQKLVQQSSWQKPCAC